MKNSEYWKQRFGQLEDAQHNKSAAAYENIRKMYEQAERELEEKIRAWYQRFADNNAISMAEARQWLTGKDLDEFKWTVQDYIAHGKENAITAQWMKQLENASSKYHISKLESLKLKTQHSLEVLAGKYNQQMQGTLSDIYQSGYYHTAFEIQKGYNTGWDITGLDKEQIEKLISKPWAVDGYNFSARIWGNKEKLLNEIHNELTVNLLTGSDPQKAIDKIAARMNVSKNVAGRLVQTEQAYFSSLAQGDCFNDLDVEEFEILATLDSHTSDICQGMDGQHFPMKDYEPGVTAPPFHVNCRSTTIPYFPDDIGFGERAARDENGKTYYVPDNMTYKEWENTFVNGGDKSGLDVYDQDGITHYKNHVEPEKPKAEKPDFTTMNLKELENWANNNLKTKFVDLKGTNVDFVRNAVNVVSQFEENFGEIEGLQVKFGGTGSSVYAKYDDKIKTLFLKKTGSIEKFEERLKQENVRYKTKWKKDKDYNATTTYSGTIWHELGHAIDMNSGQRLSKELSSTAALDEASVRISAYAGTSQGVRVAKRSEAWAENFAAYMDGGPNKAKVPEEIAKMIEGEFVKERNSGGIFGSYNDNNDPYWIKRDAHAKLYYEELKNNGKKVFVDKISKNTGFSKRFISEVYDHVFVEKHYLDDGYKVFDSSYEMAKSFQRLKEGNYTYADIVLLRHEHLERAVEKRYNLKYRDAHKLAESKYNYNLAIKKEDS